MVELSKEKNMPELLNISLPVAGANRLEIDDAADFIEWLHGTAWGRILELDLDNAWEGMLTTRIEMSLFRHLVADAQGGPYGPCLMRAYSAWALLEVDDVFFSFGYIQPEIHSAISI